MLHVKKHRYHCKSCGFNITEDIPYQMDDHKVTTQMHTYICDLLSMGFNLTEVKYITKVGINVIKDIDKKRLEKLYTQCDENGERTITPPTEYGQYLGIDEFLLHEGRHYATVIMDLMTGHVLYLQRTKKKDVVYQFMNWVGDDWMKHVEAVASDMNADFSKAFQERYPEIKVVYDYFHIKKNFLDKVINAIRKDEIRRLTEEGRNEEAASLKGCKYILLANRTTLQRNDGTVGDVTERASSMFGSTPAKQKRNLEEVYDRIIQENRLIMTADYVKEMLDYSFSCTDRKLMSRAIGQIIAVCYATRNKHFKWFGNLLKNHRDGILTHAELKLSSGKVEGTNRKIKTIRWKAYGFKDDDYFFLKIIDSTRA